MTETCRCCEGIRADNKCCTSPSGFACSVVMAAQFADRGYADLSVSLGVYPGVSTRRAAKRSTMRSRFMSL